MSIYIGSRQIISGGEESVWGTPVAPTIRWNSEVTFDNVRDRIDRHRIPSGSGSTEGSHEKGDKSAGGNLRKGIQDWWLLKFIMGDESEAEAGGVYTHTYSIVDTLPSLTLQVADQSTTDFVRTYEGCKANLASIEFAKSTGAEDAGLVYMNLDLVAEDHTDNSTTTSLANNTNDLFKYTQTDLKINNVSISTLLSGKIDFLNNFDDGRYARASNLIDEPEVQEKKYAYNFDIVVEDNSLWTLYDAGDAISNCSLTFTRGTNDDVVITFTNFYIITPPMPTNIGGRQIITLTGVFDSVGVVERNAITYVGR